MTNIDSTPSEPHTSDKSNGPDTVTDIPSPTTALGLLLRRIGASVADYVQQEPDPKPESIVAVLSIALEDLIGGIDCSACRLNLSRHISNTLVRNTMRPPQANAPCSLHAEPPVA
jgi:hypothetical protein